MSTAFTWRDALRAAAATARVRANNSRPLPGGPSDPETLGRHDGSRWAFTVMAEELEYLATDCPSREALDRLRGWLREKKS